MPAVNIKPSTGNLKQLLSLCCSEWKLFILGLLFLGVASGINLLLPQFVRVGMNEGSFSLAQDHIRSWAMLFVGLFAVQALAFYFRSLCFSTLGLRIVRDLRARTFASLVRKPMSFFDAERVGELTSSLSSDAQLVQDALSQRISVFLRYSVQVLIGIACMLSLSWRMSLIILLTLPLLVGISFLLSKKLRLHSRETQSALGTSQVVAEETFSFMRIVKAFHREDWQEKKYLEHNAKVYASGMQRSSIAAFFSSFVSFLLNVAIVGVLCFGLFLVEQKHLSLGDLTAFLLYGVIVSVSFAFLTGSITDIVQALGASERLFSWISGDEAPKTSPHQPQAVLSNAIPHAPLLEFSQVSFHYPSRPDSEVLRSISFQILPGTRTALVGPSGAGKSSIIASLLALYPIQSGNIFFGGQNILQIPEGTLRDTIALVPQDPELFGDSILENIRFGKLDATREEVEWAAKKARIHDFISTLPDGYQTLVGERGLQLSGGERQRIAIARAIIRKPLLLILDEATSALDGIHELAIREALKEIGQEMTILIIAHRLASIQDADRVLVLEQGQVVDQGTHQELISRSGAYLSLVESQWLEGSSAPQTASAR